VVGAWIRRCTDKIQFQGRAFVCSKAPLNRRIEQNARQKDKVVSRFASRESSRERRRP
jgi:hypothetical protein